jgi:predicted DCC family thiol-disulfide oxidoreductase YuxK
MKLTMFYDSLCPLCVAEVQQLKDLDKHGALLFVDIHREDFRTRWPGIDPVRADRILHAQRADGSMVYGLDVSAEAWALVGRHRWLKLLRLPVVRWFSDLAYSVLARHRYTISFLLTGQRRCTVCKPSGDSAVYKMEPDVTSRTEVS